MNFFLYKYAWVQDESIGLIFWKRFFEIHHISCNHFMFLALAELRYETRTDSHNPVDYVLCSDNDNPKHSKIDFLHFFGHLLSCYIILFTTPYLALLPARFASKLDVESIPSSMRDVPPIEVMTLYVFSSCYSTVQFSVHPQWAAFWGNCWMGLIAFISRYFNGQELLLRYTKTFYTNHCPNSWMARKNIWWNEAIILLYLFFWTG